MASLLMYDMVDDELRIAGGEVSREIPGRLKKDFWLWGFSGEIEVCVVFTGST